MLNKFWKYYPFLVGADRLYDNIEDMIGYKPLFLIKYGWKYLTPLFCAVSICLQNVGSYYL